MIRSFFQFLRRLWWSRTIKRQVPPEERKSWVRRATDEDKIKDWESRMLKAGPLPHYHGDWRVAYAATRNLVEQLPNEFFEETTSARGTLNPLGQDGWGVTLYNAKDEEQGYLFYPDGRGIILFTSQEIADLAGVDFMNDLRARRKVIAEEIQKRSEQAIWEDHT